MRRAVIRGLVAIAAIGALVVPAAAQAQQRVVEPVSPAESQGNQPLKWTSATAEVWGSQDGDHAIYQDEILANDLKVSTRTATGWTTTPLQGRLPGDSMSPLDFSPDMSTIVWAETSPFDPTPGIPDGLFTVHDGRVSTIATWDGAVNRPDRPYYLAGSEDRTRLVLRAPAGALPGPSSDTGLYRWSADHGFEPIDVDMSRYTGADCADDPSTDFGREDLATIGASNNGMMGVSADGRAVVVKTPACTVGGTPVPSHLVLWHDDGTSTDITPPVGGGDDGDATFVGMRQDVSRVFFTTAAQLEASDTNGADDLYVWESGKVTRLTDGALAAGQALASPDGSTAWFESSQPIDGLGEAGEHNVFAWDGRLALVGTFADAPLLKADRYSQLSEDGSYLVYWNTTNQKITRLGRDGVAVCVSCAPEGVTLPDPTPDPDSFPYAFSSMGISDTDPTGSADRPRMWEPFISADGSTVVFQTDRPLDPRDTNGVYDTYAWENGRQVLVSSGTEPTFGTASGMSADGSSIFFQQGGTQSVPGVTDTYTKVWVSRVGGGFPDAKTSDTCGTGCQGPLSPPPALPVAASVTFDGPGNLEPAAEAAPTSGKPSVTKPSGTVRGTSALVRVKVPGAGVIHISGTRIGTAERTVLKAGTYQVRVALTRTWQRSLARHRSITASLKVRFTPVDGQAASRSVQLKFARKATKKATSRKAAHS